MARELPAAIAAAITEYSGGEDLPVIVIVDALTKVISELLADVDEEERGDIIEYVVAQLPAITPDVLLLASDNAPVH